jgi:hypothetical protein
VSDPSVSASQKVGICNRADTRTGCVVHLVAREQWTPKQRPQERPLLCQNRVLSFRRSRIGETTNGKVERDHFCVKNEDGCSRRDGGGWVYGGDQGSQAHTLTRRNLRRKVFGSLLHDRLKGPKAQKQCPRRPANETNALSGIVGWNHAMPADDDACTLKIKCSSSPARIPFLLLPTYFIPSHNTFQRRQSILVGLFLYNRRPLASFAPLVL